MDGRLRWSLVVGLALTSCATARTFDGPTHQYNGGGVSFVYPEPMRVEPDETGTVYARSPSALAIVEAVRSEGSTEPVLDATYHQVHAALAGSAQLDPSRTGRPVERKIAGRRVTGRSLVAHDGTDTLVAEVFAARLVGFDAAVVFVYREDEAAAATAQLELIGSTLSADARTQVYVSATPASMPSRPATFRQYFPRTRGLQ